MVRDQEDGGSNPLAPTTSGYNKQLMERETSWYKAGGVVRKKPRPIPTSFTNEDISEFFLLGTPYAIIAATTVISSLRPATLALA